tara:strand:- start:153 stop:350 length:198 start_codon:yes stop_codon:yes gene_type:complete
MSNEVTIKINVSDSLLSKIISLLSVPTPTQNQMDLPMALLGALAQPPPKAEAPPKEKAKVGFKIK